MSSQGGLQKEAGAELLLGHERRRLHNRDRKGGSWTLCRSLLLRQLELAARHQVYRQHIIFRHQTDENSMLEREKTMHMDNIEVVK